MFWIREVVGWILILSGVYVMLLSMQFLQESKVIEAGILSAMGIFIFRGAIHLIKVATAARVVLSAEREARAALAAARGSGTVSDPPPGAKKR